MSDLELLAVLAAALTGGVVGSMVPIIVRSSIGSSEQWHATARSTQRERLDPRLSERVQDLSEQWATERGHPEASYLAAGYLWDAAEDVQRRWREYR